MITCRCIKSDVRGQLERDEHEPSLLACSRCCLMLYDPCGDLRGFSCLRELDITAVSPGETFVQAVSRQFGSRAVVIDVSPTNKALEIDGQPVGEIFVIRRTADGEVMLFPGNSTPWYERVVHPDDVAIGFGIRTVERPTSQRQVWQILCDNLQRRSIVFAPQILLRVA